MRSARFWVVVLLLSSTALMLHLRGDVDRVPHSRPLSEFPLSMGALTGTDIAINPEELQILGKGQFLNREYTTHPVPAASNGSASATIGLYIAYFSTQRSEQAIHSPQNCLPGAGWSFESSGVTQLTDSAGKKYTVGDYLITDGNSTDEALYWYQLHGRSIAGDYAAKLYTLADSIRYGRSDEGLVRIITPLEPREERGQARARAVGFAEHVISLLPNYVPN